MCEPFKQWVIEDHFPLGRPAWESVGAQMTTDVLPCKLMSFTIASWFRYLTGFDESGKEMPMLDPMAQTLRERAKAAGRDAAQLLAMPEIFNENLANSPAL